MRKLSTLLAVSLISMAVGTARAQVVAYDHFDYTAGSQLWGGTQVAGAQEGIGGSGWGSTWSATSAAIATNFGTGLIYGDLPTSGGGVVMGVPGGPTATTASAQRLLPDTLGTLATSGAGTVWISFLSQNWRTDTSGLAGYREAKLALFSGATLAANGSANVNGTERLAVGTPNTYSVGASDTLSLYQGSTYVSSGLVTPRGASPANTVFVLMRINVDNTTAADTAYAWFNPDISSEPSIATAIQFTLNDLSAVNALRFQAGNLNTSGTNAVFEVDELRVGLNYINVIPEPGMAVLAGLGGLALLLRLRKHN
jgi:hypothetical protein